MTGTDRSPRRSRSRLLGLALAALLVAVVVAVLVVGRSDDEPARTTAERPPRPFPTATTASADGGPRALDPGARRALRQTDEELIAAIAGRGRQLDRAARELATLSEELAPAMATLAAPRARLGPGISALARTVGEIAPAAGSESDLLRHLDATLTALAPVADSAIGEGLREGARLQTTVTRDLPRLRSSLADGRRLLVELRPGLRALRRATPTLVDGLRGATTVAGRLPDADLRLRDSVASLDRLGQDPLVRRSLDAQLAAARSLRPILAEQTPGQVVCNSWTLLARNLASSLSIGNDYGTWARALLVVDPTQIRASSTPAARRNANPYPNAAQPGARRECEAGREPYAPDGRVGHPAGNQGTAGSGAAATGRGR